MVPAGFVRLSDQTQVTGLLPQDFFVVVRDVGGTPTLAIIERTDLSAEIGGAGNTDLGIGVLTPTSLEITSSTGTGVTLPLAGGGDPGLLSDAQSTILDDLAVSPGNDFYYGSNGSGLLGYHPLPTGGGGGATDLSIGTQSATNLEVVSSTGTNVLLPLADSTNSGLLSPTGSDLLGALATNPGNSFYYGTDATGTLDYHALPVSSAGDMEKSVYDIDDNGIVDDSEAIGGVIATGVPTPGQVLVADTAIGASWQDPPGGALEIERETLSGDLTLVEGDPQVQIIDPLGGNRIVTLPVPFANAHYEIIVIGDTTSTVEIQEDDGTSVLTLQDQVGVNFRAVLYHDGTDWIVLSFIRG